VLDSLTRRNALLLTSRRDGRVFFVLPQSESSLVGTTESEHQEDLDSVQADTGEISYLLSEVRCRWPERGRDAKEVRRAFAGVRPLVRDSGPLGRATREERLIEEDGLLSVVGGKYTTYRAVAERVVNRVLESGEKTAGECVTRERPLGSAGFGTREQTVETARKLLAGKPGLSGEDAERLGPRYGSRVPEVIELVGECGDSIEEESFRILQAEVVYAVRHEMARRLDDVLLRRLGLWEDRGRCIRAAEPVARWMAEEAGWSDERTRGETERLTHWLDVEGKTIRSALSI
jgi:glycerol-3-phosphate dehydrogenase